MMFFGWLIPLVLLVFGGMWFFNNNGANRAGNFNGSSAGSTPSAQKTPREILQERYARGEIDQEQYEKMNKTLIQ